MFIPDPGCDFIPSLIPDTNSLHPGSRIRIEEFKYFNPKKWFLRSRKYDPGCSSRIRMLNFYPSRIPGSKKAPDPGSATLFYNTVLCCGSELFFPVSGVKKALDAWIQDPNPQQKI